MCLYRHRGVNLPLLSVYDAMDLEVEILASEFDIEVDRALISRFKLGFDYDKIYLDFDDTVYLQRRSASMCCCCFTSCIRGKAGAFIDPT